MMETGLRHLETEAESRGRVADADSRWEPSGGRADARRDALACDRRVWGWGRIPRDRDSCLCLTEPSLVGKREVDG